MPHSGARPVSLLPHRECQRAHAVVVHLFGRRVHHAGPRVQKWLVGRGSAHSPEAPSLSTPTAARSSRARFNQQFGALLDTGGASGYSPGRKGKDAMALPTPLISRSPKVMSGTVVFTGTRAPVQTLMDYIEEGSSLAEFLEDFPTVSRDHAIAVLELAKDSLFTRATAA